MRFSGVISMSPLKVTISSFVHMPLLNHAHLTYAASRFHSCLLQYCLFIWLMKTAGGVAQHCSKQNYTLLTAPLTWPPKEQQKPYGLQGYVYINNFGTLSNLASKPICIWPTSSTRKWLRYIMQSSWERWWYGFPLESSSGVEDACSRSPER